MFSYYDENFSAFPEIPNLITWFPELLAKIEYLD